MDRQAARVHSFVSVLISGYDMTSCLMMDSDLKLQAK